MLETYLDVTKWTSANIAAINIEDERSYYFKNAIISYGTIRMRIPKLLDKSQTSGDVILEWDRPFCEPCEAVDTWVEDILRTLQQECSDRRRAATYFYHRIYSTVMLRKSLALQEPASSNIKDPAQFDELVRLVMVGIPELFKE